MSETSTTNSTVRAYLALGGIIEALSGAAYTIRIAGGVIEAQGRVCDGMVSCARLLGATLVESEVRDGMVWDEYVTTTNGVRVRITAHEPAEPLSAAKAELAVTA